MRKKTKFVIVKVSLIMGFNNYTYQMIPSTEVKKYNKWLQQYK